MTKKKQKNVLVRNIYRCAISTGYSKIKPGECAEVDAALADAMLDAGFVEIMDLDTTTPPETDTYVQPNPQIDPNAAPE